MVQTRRIESLCVSGWENEFKVEQESIRNNNFITKKEGGRVRELSYVVQCEFVAVKNLTRWEEVE